ncbi:hypothetical protein [Bosea sp. PAMC 26642]|uniref:hypothetical protein n=1 Tax=Bosea sp. (strain PAMC 26642) TaxID=1792307 RepID=UPI000770143D|nr:hypothetical protein [Bosea sp. PAMC 26642]AMJ61978.1 hypothetical protein AXW83_18230 [Bosea sp. PAMC 26642]
MSAAVSLAKRVSKLEASRRPTRCGIVRVHTLDCAPEEREARLAAIDEAEPDAVHIVHVIVEAGRLPMAPKRG